MNNNKVLCQQAQTNEHRTVTIKFYKLIQKCCTEVTNV